LISFGNLREAKKKKPLMLEIRNVTKKFGGITALSDVSFDVSDGEFIFITGASGSGKTTLLRLILREFKPNGGEIIFDGKNISKLPSREIPKLRQQFGFVFQDFKVLSERTVRENVEVALAVIGLSRNEWKARVDHVLDLVDLRNRAELFPSQLSGGELQRVSMARALVVNPKVILADEPTGNLDWETADKLMDLFEKINREGKTVIMATHNKLIIDRMEMRTLELKEGKIIFDKKSKSGSDKKDKNNIETKKD
jgi:cell division transport system ATP-binding protein